MSFQLLFSLFYALISIYALGVALIRDLNFSGKQLTKFSLIIITYIALGYTLLFGLRSDNVGEDTETYMLLFKSTTTENLSTDILHGYLILFIKLFTENERIYLLVMSILFLGAIITSVRLYCRGNDISKILLFFSIISMFSFQSMGINIIRQGISISFLILAMVLWINRRLVLLSLFSLIIAIGFHFSAIFPLIVIVGLNMIPYLKKIWIALIIYFVSIILSYLGFGIITILEIIPGFKLYTVYFSGDTFGYNVGFKPQFVLYNTFFLLIFFVIRSLIKTLNIVHHYDKLLLFYLYFSVFFFFCFQIPFSDRMGLFSWLLIPFLLSPIFSLRFPWRISSFVVIFLISVFSIFLFLI